MTLEQVMKAWIMSNEEPTIKPILSKTHNRSWAITLEESWPLDVINKSSSSHSLDSRVKWTEEELKKWPDVKRMAWDQWYFPDKKSAEKFITLYSLIWAQ